MAKEYKTYILSVYDESGNKIPVPAIRGKSAYEYAQDDGYVGSEYEYQQDINPVNIKDDAEAFIIDELAKRGQLKPEFAESREWLEANGDTSKYYVLLDKNDADYGFIIGYMLIEKEVSSGPAYTNLLPLAKDTDRTTIYNGKGYKENTKLSGSGGGESTSGSGKEALCSSGFIFPVKAGDTLRIKGIAPVTGSLHYIVGYNSSNARVGNDVIVFANHEDGSLFWTTNSSSGKYTIENNDENNPKGATIVYTINTEKLGADVNAVRICAAMDENTIITINEEIKEGGSTEIVKDYAWSSTGHAFVDTNYEDRIIELETLTEAHSDKITELEEAVANNTSMMYISPDGSDSNDGLTVNTPKKTVKACINAGATKISAKRGVYKQFVQLWNVGELEIFPTDNDLGYSVGTEREPIVFDTSDSVAVSSLTAYNSIKCVAYSNANNTQFDKVFTKKSQPPIVSEYGSRYNSTVWLLSEDEKTVCIKLKPVLTIAECEAEANTFTYVSGYIYINANLSGVDKVIVPTNWESGIYINGAGRFALKEVEVRFSGGYNIDIRNCAFFDFYKCSCKYTSYGSGFHPFNSNGTMTACYATKNYDGYGISGYGHTTYVDCVSEFNFDDGMSHHNGTSGTVIGGRYEGNGKGGNTPAYGAKVNIYGGIYKDNASFGIGYLYTSDYDPSSGVVDGAIICGNQIGLNVDANCDVTAIGCIYESNISDKSIKGNFTEYSGNYIPENENGENDDNGGNNQTETRYTNKLPLAIDSSGNEYIGAGGEDGYNPGYRVSSSGEEKSADAKFGCTGFIPAVKGDIIRIKNVTQATASNDGASYSTAYFFTSGYTKTTGTISLINETYENGVYTFTIPNYDTIAYFRITLIDITDNTIITVNEEILELDNPNTPENDINTPITDEERLNLIKTWDTSIYDANIPVFTLSAEKADITEAEKTVSGVYAKYDALMARHPNYITKTDLGMCSDGVTHVYRYDFREPEPHRGITGKKEWSETKAKAIIVSGIHWEWGGIFALYNALEELADNPELFHLRRNTHLIVLPVCNPYAVANMSVRNANLVEIHRNFEVDFIYPGESGYIELGERSHGGTEPLSEVETQYIDNIFKTNTDAAFFLTCHSCQGDGVYGTGFVWASPATYYMCNMGYRLVDKLSNVWMEKYGDELADGIADYRTENLPEWDTRLGQAYLSTTNGTETKQATKYGIQGTNVEITDAFLTHGTKANPEPVLSSFTMSRGAEVYVNFMLTAFGVYDPKDKKEYFPTEV